VEERKRKGERGEEKQPEKPATQKVGMVEDNIVEITGVQGEEKYNNESSGKEHITAIAQRIKRIH
jgi:hypothetical protein